MENGLFCAIDLIANGHLKEQTNVFVIRWFGLERDVYCFRSH